MALPFGRWTNEQYANAYKQLGGFNFGFRLREVSAFNRGQKARIRSLYNDAQSAGLSANALAKVHRIPRGRGESKAAHRRRVKSAKGAIGQSDSRLRGAVMALPANSRLNFRTGEIIVTRPGRIEKFVPLDKDVFLADPVGLTDAAISRGQSEGFTAIQFQLGVSRSETFSVDDEEDIEEFEDFSEDLADGDRYTAAKFVNGYILSGPR